jgi:hypothetical protein
MKVIGTLILLNPEEGNKQSTSISTPVVKVLLYRKGTNGKVYIWISVGSYSVTQSFGKANFQIVKYNEFNLQ